MIDNIYRDCFFVCDDCEFKLSLLGGNGSHLPEDCPCCGGDLDYMSKSTREQYVKDLMKEIKFMSE
ncbi:hypothetical protein 015DV002_73 [Bacillus phage 015DV002]|nr:hypothetical protein 015DV002_73 [Bacillus phage 015DV002]QQO41304.1 hypothetical protein 015DV004_88 [Bacillus phage 015DV004]